ncbi:hypothetical protein F8154_09370 [Alkaliphilus pronyensis]|uniref:Uncharacterized protein n=1 Tax=Alkaliphilus pronyensis TaxID=1482732 RepID=A0A6I0F7H7_9FIRM|nr:hypothetical protein [Alkaliphilus pronyensis]KAB3534137.1 hypothetical protein F8154_09370 [Alkaliphilus pronyensis]
MKIGFSKTGLTINSKKFHPLNLAVKGYGLESNLEDLETDPFELLEKLAKAKDAEMTKEQKVNILKDIL